jgi:UDP-N-acetylmuramate dehydrogenase
MSATLTALDTRPLDQLGVELKQNAPLASLTTMKVGGNAEYLATVGETAHLIRVLRWARANEIPWFVIGGGSNMLIADGGMRGLVIHNRCRAVRIDPAPCCVNPQDLRPYLFAESGAPTAGAARTSVKAGLTGFEWAISLPGTIGGAVVGNAGAYGSEVKDSFEYGWMLDEHDDVTQVSLADMHYDYRASSMKQRATPENPLRAGFGSVLLSANFRMVEGDVEEIRARADKFLQHRRTTQPVEPSLGSTFVNPPGDFAGRLIEMAGLKGTRVGGVEVSDVHANFLVNRGGIGAATASDALALIQRIQARVADKFGILLEPEVQFAGEW